MGCPWVGHNEMNEDRSEGTLKDVFVAPSCTRIYSS